MATSLGAMAFTQPVLALYFRQTSLIFPLTNLLVLWAVALFLVCALPVGLLGVFLPVLARPLGMLTGLLAHYIVAVVSTLGRWRFAAVDTGQFPYLLCLAGVYLFLAAALLLRKQRLRLIVPLGCAGLLLAGALAGLASANAPTYETTILFTHDTHDHFLPMPDEEGGEYGGYTRLATLIQQERAAHPDALVLDAGDFSMGSLFQTIYATEAPELRALGAMGYDATTLGNHEFDYRARGLAEMLNAAVESGDPVPPIVQANYKPPAEDVDTWAAWNRYGIGDYLILERGGVRYGIFGLMGEEADSNAPMSGMEFEPIADAAERTVAALEEAGADFIICLSHSGTGGRGKGEDYELAKRVDGIDVILSGHTHTTLDEPLRVGDTLIVSCGEYTANLGVLTVEWKPNGEKTVADYRLLPVDETVAEDPDMAAMAAAFQSLVEEQYLSQFGVGFDEVLARSPFAFTPIGRLGAEHREDTLGSLIADSYVYAVQQAEGADYVPVDFAVVAAGVIRGSFPAGEITTSV